jgi:hypothetical protein
LFYNDILQAQQIVREKQLPQAIINAAQAHQISLESPWEEMFEF